MPVAPNNEVTQKEVEDSYEFKLMKKILKREYPWIVDILVPNDEDINKYALIFLTLVIDPYILQREKGWPFNSFMNFYLSGFVSLHHPYAYRSSYLTTIYDIDREQSVPIQDDIETTMKAIAKSPAIPQDLKLNKDRIFVVGEYLIQKPSEIPQDAVFSKKTQFPF